MADPARPKRVVVVDAENPLQEVHGEFFWREDHDAIVADERAAAFQQGFADGYAAGHSARDLELFVPRRRRRGVVSLFFIVLALLVVGSYVVTLVQSMLHG